MPDIDERSREKGNLDYPYYSARKQGVYREFISNYLFNVMSLYTGMGKFRPMITNFYVTVACDLRCRYCYPPGSGVDTETETMLGYLEKIRYRNPLLNITGGEPLLRDDIPILLRRAKELGFYPILLSTNGLRIEKIVDSLDLIDHLIISLDSLDLATNDTIVGVNGATEKIVENIRRSASLAQKHKFELSIHSAIMPENLDNFEEIIKFCGELNISLSVSPENDGIRPNPDLIGNRKYMDVISSLIEFKKNGYPVSCSYGYLRKLRRFEAHNCYPAVSPRVEADGRVYFPCQRLKHRYEHLDDYRNLHELITKNTNRKTNPACKDRCYLACYMEIDRYLHNPLSILNERFIKQWVFGVKEKRNREKDG